LCFVFNLKRGKSIISIIISIGSIFGFYNYNEKICEYGNVEECVSRIYKKMENNRNEKISRQCGKSSL